MTENKKKILLVEDDDTLSDSYIQRFEAEGFEIKRVQNGEDALTSALSFKPDLIILDIMMPKVDGFNVLDILKNTSDTLNARIVVLSALSQQEDIEKAKSMGADDYIVKSQVVLADIVEIIKKHLGVN